MSVNAFYDAYSGVQNALGDPRGDARKREQEDMRNAMLQRQMQMKEFEFGQKEQEAQRAEQQRQLEARRKANRARIIGESLYPNQQPQQADPILPSVLNQLSEQVPQGQAAPASPMTGGAPIEQAQGQAFVDPATGREGASYTATAMSRGPMLTEDEILELEARDAYKNGDFDYFDDRITLRRQRMTKEEKKGRELLANAASEVSKIQTHEGRVAAVKQFMQAYNINPEDTKIDDYFNNPQGLMQELGMAIRMGAPEKSAETNIEVLAYERKQQLEKEYGPLIEVDGGDKIYLVDGNNKVVDTIVKGISPDAALQAKTSRENSIRSASRPVVQFDPSMFGEGGDIGGQEIPPPPPGFVVQGQVRR
jgi:hypothetical protein